MSQGYTESPVVTHPFVVATGISKSFGTARVLSDVSVTIHRGEIHGLVGANGAGKSTFIKVLGGLIHADAGSIKIDGAPVIIRSPHESRKLGLGFIHQDVNLVPNFTALQNMLMGLKKGGRFGLVNWRKSRGAVDNIVRSLGIEFSLDTPVKNLSHADRTLISIARALMTDAKLIAFDEPTASLSDKETENIFKIIRSLADRGISVLYVSHRLEEVRILCDRVTVFRDGMKVETIERDELSKERLVRSIVGRDISESSTGTGQEREVSGAAPLLEVDHLSGKGVRDVSFKLHPGEVLGFGGLVGAGRTELMRLLFGQDKVSGGTIRINGHAKRIRNSKDAIRHGIGLVPEERRQQGLVMSRDVSYNINLTDLRSVRAVRWLPFTSSKKARERGQKMTEVLQIKSKGPRVPVRLLSGGNQQKVVIAKWLIRNPEIFILDEPTVGVDVGAREEIYKTIWGLANEGKGVIVVSSDPDELVKVCPRVLVMSGGSIQGELHAPFTKEDILHMSFSEETTD